MVVQSPPAARRGGCLRWLLIGLIAGVVLLGAILGSVFFALSNSEAAQTALERAAANQSLTEKIGSPIRRGWLVTGSIKVDGGSGNVDIAVPVSGPKGSATIYVRGTRSAGRWTFDLIEAAPDDGSQRIDLRKN